MTQGDRNKRSGRSFDTDVRFSSKGFTYANDGRSRNFTGTIPLIEEVDKKPFRDYPPYHGVLIYNRSTGCLELSDPENNVWICFSGNVTCPVTGEFASHLGTTDGSTNGILINPAFSLGRVASPTTPGSPFYAGSFDDDTNQDITSTNTLNWALGGGQQLTDLQEGTITTTYRDGNGSILVQEVLSPDGSLNNQSSTPNGYVQIASLVDNLDRIEGFLQVSIPSNSILGGTDYLEVEIVQDVNSVSYPQTLEFFLDKGGAPTIPSKSVQLESVSTNYLSGLKYASTGSTMRMDLEVDDIWKDTYRSDLLQVQGDDLGLGTFIVNYNATTVSGGTQPPSLPFTHDDPFIYSEVKAISAGVSNPDSSGTFKQMRYQVRDPFSIVNSALFSSTPEVLINTFSNTSTGRLETFFSEDYRLISGSGSISGIEGASRDGRAWDSMVSLAVSGALQVMPGVMIYPQDDFSSMDPSVNPDYSSITADLEFSRQFIDTLGTSRSNGVLKMIGLSEAARASGDVLIDIRVVGTHIAGNGTQGLGNEGTGWLSLNTPYNIATFLGDDGDGCFVNTGGYSAPDFEFTLGGFSTAFAENNAVEVRVTYKYPGGVSTRITRIEMLTWT